MVQQSSIFMLDMMLHLRFQNHSVPATERLLIQIHDSTEQSVQTLLNGEVAAGNHSVSWNTDNIASGVYFVRLTTTEGTVSSQAMVLR